MHSDPHGLDTILAKCMNKSLHGQMENAIIAKDNSLNAETSAPNKLLFKTDTKRLATVYLLVLLKDDKSDLILVINWRVRWLFSM